MDNIPMYLLRNAVYTNQVHINRHNFFDIVLTNDGPNLYEVRDKEILASCNLSDTIFKGIHLERQQDDQMSTSNTASTVDSDSDTSDCLRVLDTSRPIKFDVLFIYENHQRIVYYVLQIHDRLVMMKRANQTILIIEQHESILKFKLKEIEVGDTFLEIYRRDAEVEKICFNKLEPSDEHILATTEQFGDVYGAIERRVAAATAELISIKLDFQKKFYELANELKFGEKDTIEVVEERNMLSRYGDIWIKYHNEVVVIGIPVYNCTFKRRKVIENIRTTLMCDELPSLEYSYKLYNFKVDDNIVPNFRDLLSSDEDAENEFKFLKYNNEWIENENNNVLQPEEAAIICITMNDIHFRQFSSFHVKCFLQYDYSNYSGSGRLVAEDGLLHEPKVITLQNFCGNILLSTNIFYDESFMPMLNGSNVYTDLLTITSTSSRHSIEITFKDEQTKDSFYSEFLLGKLKLLKINSNTTTATAVKYNINVEDNFLMEVDNLVENMETTKLQEDFTNCEIFYQPNDGYWKGMLLRTCSQELVHRFKIYNRSKDKILTFIQSLSLEFGPNIKCHRLANNCKQLCDLKNAFNDEIENRQKLLNNKENNLTNSASKLRLQSLHEFKTDLALVNLRESLT